MTGRRTFAIVMCAAALAGCGSAGEQAAVQPSPSATPSSPSPSPTSSPSATRTPTTPATSPSVLPSTPAAAGVPAWMRGAPVTRLPTSRPVVALTFDGGAGAQGAAAIVTALAQTGVPATFFLTGQFVRSYPQTVATLRNGHFVFGNHTMTHPHVTTLTSADVIEQVTSAQAQLKQATGASPRPLFRFPYGEYDARTLNLVHSLGYGAIGWTIDSRGWQGRAAGSVDDVVNRVRAALRPGAIVLMHLGANPDDGTTYDAVALPRLITAIRAAGYTFTDLLSW